MFLFPVPTVGTTRRGGVPSSVLVTALLVLPLLMVTLASLPALLVLPFLPSGAARADRIVRLLSSWTGRLTSSRRET